MKQGVDCGFLDAQETIMCFNTLTTMHKSPKHFWVANFQRYGKHRKITEIEYKTENMENRGKQRFGDSKTKNIQENLCF